MDTTELETAFLAYYISPLKDLDRVARKLLKQAEN
jgi:hypothetical protein